MISIEEAIIKSKELPNISNGGSMCYDFGDVVLVKYILPLKYVKPGYRARENQEIVMKGINEKVSKGVNTPKHIDIKRVVEGENDVCYVLQEKCKGKNCDPMARYGETIEVVLKELKFVNNIPFKHYEKLISDACLLYEMGYESKNKNLFYDEETGFWFIDFLDNKEEKFDFNNPKTIFEVLKYVCPKPLQIASSLSYSAEISDEDREKYNILRYNSMTKFFLACKNMIPTFKKYEFFYLLDKEDKFKEYLMKERVVNRDLFNITNQDFEVYNELFSSVVNDICKEISTKGKKYWDVEVNDIRIKSNLFSLNIFYKNYICKNIKREDFEEEWEYDSAIDYSYNNDMIDLIYKTICSMEPNENISNFISEYESKRKKDLTL